MRKEVILGIDISTSRIGIAAVTTDDQLIFADTLTFKDKEMSLENRAIMFQETLHKICISQKIEKIIRTETYLVLSTRIFP